MSNMDAARWRSGGVLNPNATSFQPSPSAAVSRSASDTERLPCRFFLMGKCKYGSRCVFRHDVPEEKEILTQGLSETNQLAQTLENILTINPLLSNESTSPKIPDQSMRDFNGALVRFGKGAEVSDLKLASDFSTIQILGLPVGSNSEDIGGLLDSLGYSIQRSCIFVKSLGDGALVAEVRVEDPKFAADATQKFEGLLRNKGKEGLSVRSIQGGHTSTAQANRLQMSSVSCSWYAASRVAWLQYHNLQSAVAAKNLLEGRSIIFDRKIQCSIQHPPPWATRNRIWSVQVGNLNVRTKEGHFRHTLVGAHKPDKVVMGKPSHPLSDHEAANLVESLLNTKGKLESFRIHPNSKSVKLKATATFMTRDQAVEAVQSLHNTAIQGLGNSKLYVNHLMSVKYNILAVIYHSIDPELAQLKQDIWQSGHIHLKSYPPTDPAKSFITLRVFGEDLKRMAEAKSALEKLLAGSIVMKSDTVLWDAYFLIPEFLIYLKHLSSIYKLYIHRDTRKSQLLLYGGSTDDRVGAQQSLIEKVESLQTLIYTIVLTSDLLPKAMKGGWKCVKDKFGDDATLNISSQPKTIIIHGSIRDFQEAQSLLLEGHIGLVEAAVDKDDSDCCACWTEATEPLKTTCSHIYCKECFNNQISAAGDGGIPIRCFGAEGNCLNLFNLDELKEMLSSETFEKILNESFSIFIRTHPEKFQYCPTPDCPQIYRISTDGQVNLCQTCLTPICTSCNVISHDGMTCSEYKYLSSEGDKLFQKWKKDNDGRDCPKCKSTITKSFGCNHMECAHCRAHICWFCMKVLNTGDEVYSHMEMEH